MRCSRDRRAAGDRRRLPVSAGRSGDGCGGGPGRAAARPFGGCLREWGRTAQFGRGCRRSLDRFGFVRVA